MSDRVDFDIDAPQHPQPPRETSKFAQFVIKNSEGLIRTDIQAHIFLFALSAVMIIISIFLALQSNEPSKFDLKQQELYPPGAPTIR